MSSDQYVKYTREKLGLTQTELAKLVGRDRRSIIRYERGGELPEAVRLALKYLASQRKKNGKRR